MFKSFKILVFYVLLFVCTENINSLESEKTAFIPGQMKTYSDELKNNYSEIIEIKVEVTEQNMLIGNKGVIRFKTDFNDTHIFNISTIEQETLFKAVAVAKIGNDFNISCRLWKTKDGRISLFCNVDGQLTTSYDYITIEDQSIEYNNVLIKISFPQTIHLQIYDGELPFLYSDNQTINIKEGQNSYEIKFKVEYYNNDLLYIHGTKNNYAILDNCEKNDSELICRLSKEKIEEILILKNEPFEIGLVNDDEGLIKFIYVSDININYENVAKENIYIKLEKLVGEITELNTYYAFESNITLFSNFISDTYKSNFYIKKMSKRPLMIFMKGSNNTILEELYDSNIDYLHYKYNFIIRPFKYNNTISISNDGTDVLLTYPEKLDYNLNDSYYIRYIMTNPYKSKGIRLNLRAKKNLICIERHMFKRCDVPKSHFRERKSGYFNTYHINHEDNYNIFYDASLFNVILPIDKYYELYIENEDNKNNQYIGNNGILKIVLDYYDNETQIFVLMI